MLKCDCINIKHDKRCNNAAILKCAVCNDLLCNSCSKNHHAHTSFGPIPQESGLSVFGRLPGIPDGAVEPGNYVG